MDERVPMPTAARWIADDDVRLSSVSDGPRVGRRFLMDVSEAALAQIGARGLEECVRRLGQQIAYQHQHDIQRAVDTLLMDASWAQPIIEDALRQAVREFVMALWNDEEKCGMREWFDLLIQKAKP